MSAPRIRFTDREGRPQTLDFGDEVMIVGELATDRFEHAIHTARRAEKPA